MQTTVHMNYNPEKFKTSLKYPTPIMIELLMDCHEREILKMPTCEALEEGAKGLLNRNLVKLKDYFNEKGKKYFAIFLTEEGRLFLKNHNIQKN